MSRKAGRASRKGGLKNGRRATRKGGLKRGGLKRGGLKRGGLSRRVKGGRNGCINFQGHRLRLCCKLTNNNSQSKYL